MAERETKSPETVALFVTCLVDLMRPNVGGAAVKLLMSAGYAVAVPEGQTCCGQPNYNNGDRKSAKQMAERTIELLDGYDYVVLPSGSCAAMLKIHYPSLFDLEDPIRSKAEGLAGRTWELSSFLRDVAELKEMPGTWAGSVTYHDACSGLRELNIKSQPRDLISRMPGIDILEMTEPDVCCGFGGTFCVKYPEVSTRMAEKKVADIENTGADIVVTGDVGCLLNIEGTLHRRKSKIVALHTAELLAGVQGRKDADR